MGRTKTRHGTAVRLAVLLVSYCAATFGHAHGFGQRYDLPVPLWLYLTGAGAAVAFSFVVMAWVFRHPSTAQGYPRINLLTFAVGRAFAHPSVAGFCRALAVGVLVLILVAGWWGAQNPFKNIAPTLIWVVWWVGVAYVSALVGNLWALINPLNTLFASAEAIYAKMRSGAALSRGVQYPTWLSLWPAVALFALFTWTELIWEHSDRPASLATAVFLYALLTWCGMWLFGREQWLQKGEVFALVFGLLARFAPTEVRCLAPRACERCSAPQCRDQGGGCVNCYACFRRAEPAQREWNLRPYAVGLLTERPLPWSETVLVVVILATVTFDGLLETPAWAAILARFVAPAPAVSLTDEVVAQAATAAALVESLGLVALPLLFLGVFLLTCRLANYCASVASVGEARTWPAGYVARCFVLTLIPIAIAYQLAHYLSFLFMAGQYLIPLSSDPFGLGWNLFGSANYFVRLGLVDARLIWNVSVSAIVLGHIAAVYLAHMMALRIFPDKRAALASQYPMLLLMVGYTMVSLWIMAQPIVTSRFG